MPGSGRARAVRTCTGCEAPGFPGVELLLLDSQLAGRRLGADNRGQAATAQASTHVLAQGQAALRALLRPWERTAAGGIGHPQVTLAPAVPQRHEHPGLAAS